MQMMMITGTIKANNNINNNNKIIEHTYALQKTMLKKVGKKYCFVAKKS